MKTCLYLIFILFIAFSTLIPLGCSPSIVPVSQEVISLEPVYTIPTSDNVIKNFYSWESQGENNLISLDIKESFYKYYKVKRWIITSSPDIYSIYITHPVDDSDLKVVAYTLAIIADKKGYDLKQHAMLIIDFVRSLPYISDLDSTGLVENPRFPTETLVDMEGDCEDSSFLLAQLLQLTGFNVCLLTSKNHCAVGISVTPDKYPYYEYNGKKYYYIESTSSNINYQIGQIPPIFKYEDFTVVPLNPRPLLLIKLENIHNNGITTIIPTIENVGSTESENTTITLTIKDKKQNVLYSESVEVLSINIDNECRVKFDLRFRSAGTYDLSVICVYQYNFKAYTSTLDTEIISVRD
jgi:hypothetical protein